MLRTQGLRYRYADGGPEMAFPDLNVDRGQELLLLGASGTGKTTLLHLIAGMRTPDAGEVTLNGDAFSTLSTSDRDLARGRHMGIVFQTAHFVRSLTVSENLALARTLAGLDPDPDRIAELLAGLGLSHKLNARVDALSVGEQQRVSIARAVVHGPGIILADEPTSALDDVNTDAVLDLLRTQASEAGAALLIVTHDQRLKDRMADRVELTPNPTAA
ncbi:MAG: ABC transporter ATP-binding protein [Flavobacteriales bacterium]